MWVRVLGAAAGGGFPQWNCNCPSCRGARDGSLPCRPGTQSSIAVSADYRRWFLFNASPDIRQQIEAFPPLWPIDLRQTPIQAVVLSDAELDHTVGLLSLREGRVLRVYATAWVHTALSEWNPILRTLGAFCEVDWQRVPLREDISLRGPDEVDCGLRCQAFSTTGTKVAAFASESVSHPEASVGYRITDTSTGSTLVYVPAVQRLSAAVKNQLQGCTCLLFDGTCWEDDELARLGIAGKTARAMGHLPIGGAGGSLEQLAVLDVRRKVFIHINNTNPILIEDSPQRQAVQAQGIEVAFDGMEMEV
jgi:pyrroloquinoline quinone biosynthesis protein B